MDKLEIARMSDIEDRQPVHALVGEVDLVIVKLDSKLSVLYGRCGHRGALLADGRIEGDKLSCGVHDWDHRVETGVSAYNNSESLAKFSAWVEDEKLLVDADEIVDWALERPQPFDREAYLEANADTGGDTTGEQEANSRYFYELASARLGFSWEQLDRVQAFHFKGGQSAKTGNGGHKVNQRIAEVRGPKAGEAAISPARFPDWTELRQIRDFADQGPERTGGIPVGYKLSAQHIEKDSDASLEVGVDNLIVDGRGGGTGAAPLIFRDNMSVPTIPALARARRHLDRSGHADVTLVITGGLRNPADFVKALALGADATAMRACHTNNCPVGIATQKPQLVDRLVVELMQVMARACGHDHLSKFVSDDLSAWKRERSELSGVPYGGLA